MGARTFLTYGRPFRLNLRRQVKVAEPLATEFFPSVSIAQLPDQLLAKPVQQAKLLAAIAQSRPEGAGGETAYDSYSGTEGHLATLTNDVEYGKDAEAWFFDPRFPLLGPFSAFPNGIRLLSAKIGAACLEAEDPVAFLEQHEKEIVEFEKDVFDEPKPRDWTYEDNYIVLGNGSIVRCMLHRVVHLEDGTAIHVLHLQTSSFHLLDGAFLWAWRFDPKDPGTIRALGFQAGKHPWYDLDTVNAAGGVALFDYVNRAGPYMMAARDLGPVTPGDTNLIPDFLLRLSGRFLAGLDRISPIGQYMRLKGPPNTRAESAAIDSHALERAWPQPPEAIERVEWPQADWVGVVLDGESVIVQEAVFGQPVGPPGEGKVLEQMAALTEPAMNQGNWRAIRAEVLALATERFGDTWARQSFAELLDTLLLGDPACRFAIERIVHNQVLGPVAARKLGRIIADVAREQDTQRALRATVRAKIRTDVTLPLLAQGGALHSALRLAALEWRVSPSGQAIIKAQEAEAAAADEALAWLRAKEPANEGERRAIEAEIARLEEAKRKAAPERARLAELLADLADADRLRRELEEAMQAHAKTLFPSEAS